MLIQGLIILLVVAAHEHDTHQISEGVLHDLPIPRRGLRISSHDVPRDAEALGTDLCIEILVRQMLLVQEERQVPLLAIYAGTGQHLPSPRQADGYHTIRAVLSLGIVVLHYTRISEVRSRVQDGIHGTLDTFLDNKEIVGGQIQGAAVLDTDPLGSQKATVILVMRPIPMISC